MTPADLLAHCLAKPGAWRDTPWEGDVVVKVHDKVFAFLGADPDTEAGGDPGARTDGTASVGVKCGATREEADAWIAEHPDAARPMPYLGRSGWNTLSSGRSIPDDELLEAVDESYARVVGRLPRKHRPEGWDA